MKEQLNQVQKNYNDNIISQHASTYEESTIYAQDIGIVVENFQTSANKILNISNSNISSIQTISNKFDNSKYTNTFANLEDARINISTCYQIIKEEIKKIKEKSELVYQDLENSFNDYKAKHEEIFEYLNSNIFSYDDIKSRISNLENNSKINGVDYSTAIQNKKNELSNIEKQFNINIDAINNNDKYMLECLEKGLKKKPTGVSSQTHNQAVDTSIQTNPNETETITNSDGSQKLTKEDGTVFEKRSDGTTILTNSDGTETITNSDGSQKPTKEDGTVFEKRSDGTTILTNSDGTETITNSDGSQ